MLLHTLMTFILPCMCMHSTTVESAAASAIQHFYHKLVQLPLDENTPMFFSRQLITRMTLETVGLPNMIRQKKNETILLGVIDAVKQKPDLLTDFCEILDSMDITKQLAHQIRGNSNPLSLLSCCVPCITRVCFSIVLDTCCI